MKRLLIFLPFLLLMLSSVNGQRFTSFSGDPGTMVDEMKEFFATAPADRKKESDLVMRRFTEFWDGPWLTVEMQDHFMNTANVMLKRKMRPYPHFRAFIDAYAAFSMSPLSDFTEEWGEMILYHAENDVSTFHNKMDNYVILFNDALLFQSNNSRWRAEGEITKIGIDEEPFVEFELTDLIGASPQDSLTIYNTAGAYYPSSLRWKGKGGDIFWDRAGMGGDLKAQLDDYVINVNTPRVTGNNATLIYPQLFPTPIKGIVEDKAGLETTEEKATYPRFKSYDNNIVIPNIYENVDYIGGFEMRGASIMGSANEKNLARINIKKDHKIVASASSISFLFRTENILSDETKVSIYLEKDSISHAAASFRYNTANEELLISRQKNGIGRSPFIDSYHKIDIYAEAILWKLNTETIEIKPIFGFTTETPAIFESQNYFEKSVMRTIQGFNDVSPLYSLWELFRTYKYEKLPFKRVVAHFKKSESDIRQMMIDFAAMGFIEYDIHNDEIIYRSKIAQYLNNDVGQKDYDQIKIESATHYASIDLTNYDLRVTGCEFFALSDAQIVNVYPTDEKVTIRKGRDMLFSGRVIAGLFDFVTHNCEFDYEKFRVDMNVIDSMIMYVEDKQGPQNMYGEYRLQKVKSVVEEISGTLFIDEPSNKSGKIDYPDYPIFESRKGGKVFYDQPYVLNGHYKRDQFFFALDLFRIVNLDNFVIDSMRFKGYLNSGGIFPDIHEELVTRPDFSLGFVYRTDANGLQAYQRKGHYYGLIDLSNKGLRGKGDIKYQTSMSNCDSLTFYLDRTTGKVTKHEVTPSLAGIEFPHALVHHASLNWEPYEDQMFIHTINEPMSVFDETELTGFSKLTPYGMYGGGVVKFKRADLTSRNFYFKHHELLADTANLRIFALEEEGFAFTTDNYNSHIDFKTREGKFISNGDVSEVFFVKNEMKANASDFDWIPIDENVLRFKWKDEYADVDINATPSRELVDMISEHNVLTATNPDKKGLHFSALSAEFDFGTNIINADGVRFINSGDAAIIPHDGKVTIYEKARLQPFTNSRILAGRENKFHEIYNANANILTANKFNGSGYYDYIDENEMVYQIHFDTIWFQNTTQGKATIPMEAEFKFSPYFGFDGRAELHSDKEFLYYVGGVEFIHDCDLQKPARLLILQEIDPLNIYIEIHDRSKDVNDRKAVVAIASTNKDGRIYTCFGAAKDQFNDAEYISVFGYITYDKTERCFKAGSMEKLEDVYAPGNIVYLDHYNCVATGRGAIDMGTKLGRIDFNTTGTIINYMKADSAVMNLTTSIDFFFNKEAMAILYKAINESYSLDFVGEDDDNAFEWALIDILGEEDYQTYLTDFGMGSQNKKLPPKLQVNFLFTNMDFEWDRDNSAFVSQLHLPLIIFNSEHVYRSVTGRVVIEKRGSRNRLYIYFEFDDDYYIFQFENNIMYGYSSNPDFNNAISKVKAKNRMITADREKKLPSFSYRLGNRATQKKFVNKFYIIEEEEED